MEVVNIVNRRLMNQLETGDWITRGFKALGLKVTTTDDTRAQGDITVVHGPNYAKQGKAGNVLWLDRCWYGNTKEWVSLGWKADENTRRFVQGDGQRLLRHEDIGVVEVEPKRRSIRVIALDDYQQTVLHKNTLHYDRYRGHPAREKHTESLYAAMHGFGVALTGTGTCAAQAKLAGLRVICYDPHNIVHSQLPRREWAGALAWTQFHMDEIACGDALALLLADL